MWRLSQKDEVVLDCYEGVKNGYYTKLVTGVVEEKTGAVIDVLIYIASMNSEGQPRTGYLEKIVAAAQDHSFGKEYIAFLKSHVKK